MELVDNSSLTFAAAPAVDVTVMLRDYFAARDDAEAFFHIQQDLTELVRGVLSANPASMDRLTGLGLTAYDTVRFYVANSIIHWIAGHGFSDSQGLDCENYLAHVFDECLQDIRLRDVLSPRHMNYLQSKYGEVVAARTRASNDPHDAVDHLEPDVHQT